MAEKEPYHICTIQPENNQLVIDIGLDFPQGMTKDRVILWDNLKLITSKYFNEFLK